jgi:hypothetical protein
MNYLTVAVLFTLAATPLPVANGGRCLDARKVVPMNLGEPYDYSTDVVRIDKLVTTSTALGGRILGFVYTREDGRQFFSTRSTANMTNPMYPVLDRFLDLTAPRGLTSKQSAERQLSKNTNGYVQYTIIMKPETLTSLDLATEECVVWPRGIPLPDQPQE